MKKKSGLGNWLLLAAIIALLILPLFSFDNDNYVNRSYGSVITDSLEESELIPDTIPYKQYVMARDSILRQNRPEHEKVSMPVPDFLPFGYASTIITDRTVNKEMKYFLAIRDARLHSSSSFYAKNGKYYLKVGVTDRRVDSIVTVGHFENKEIGVKYVPESLENSGHGTLLIPVTKRSYNISRITGYVCLFLFPLLYLFILLFLPARIIYRISTGKAFVRQNVRDLRIIAWSIVALTTFSVVLAMLFNYFIGHRIPAEINLPAGLALTQNTGWLIAALAAFILAIAFQKGYEIQKLNRLTI